MLQWGRDLTVADSLGSVCSAGGDSNPLPPPCKGGALPDELQPLFRYSERGPVL